MQPPFQILASSPRSRFHPRSSLFARRSSPARRDSTPRRSRRAPGWRAPPPSSARRRPRR
ncbi:unnamed protein product [Spirodela intermedia]|uniref:Uncharacterized protein n=1 Tax=Spirodela intermedia TaxID=51605 RepID=A0A7I8L2R9_SPIIN|nr:unnamed protein product [Spirodela intermedia]